MRGESLLAEVVIAYLVIISAAMAIIDYLSIASALRDQMYALDLAIVAVLLVDFLRRAIESGRPLGYVVSHAYELPALLPLYLLALPAGGATILGALRLLRLYRLVRLALLLSRSSAVVEAFSSAARRTQFITVLSALFLTVISSATLVYFLEAPLEGSNIKSFWEALWWAFATVTTVGYGDYYPVSAGGKIVGVLTMMIGIAFFSAFAGLVAVTLSELSKQEER